MTNQSTLVGRVLKARYFKHSSFLEATLGHNPSYSWTSIWGSKALLKEGLAWRVGNGLSIPVWTGNWLLTDMGWQAPSSPMGANLELVVGDLINQSTNEWKEEAVRVYLAPNDAEAALSIPRSYTTRVDTQFWWPEKFGTFTVKSAYMLGTLGRQEFIGPNGDVRTSSNAWLAIWGLKAPPKLRHFSWRAYNNALGARELLHKRKVVDSGIYARCNAEVESIRHALLECQGSREAWENSSLEASHSILPQGDFKQLVDWMVGRQDKQSLLELCTNSWIAWTIRNETIFGQTSPNPAFIREGFRRMVRDYQAQLANTKRGNARNQETNSGRWVRPNSGVVKINTDATILHDGHVGLGVILRDHTGKILAAASRREKARGPVLLAELLAIRWGLDVAKLFSLKRIHLESDSLVAVKQIESPRRNSAYSGMVVEDIITTSQTFETFHVSHVSRAGNTVAHLAARLCPDNKVESIYVSSLPEGLCDLADLL